MMSQLTSVLMGILFLQSTVVDAKTDEFFEMKLFNHDFRVSDSEMRTMLDKANLTGHGYKKEVTKKVVSKPDGGGTELQTAHYYYKDVDCSQMEVVVQELERLLPDVVQNDLETKFEEETKTRHLDNMRFCKVGLEVHFKDTEGCYKNQKAVFQRRKKRGCGWLCIICISIELR